VNWGRGKGQGRPQRVIELLDRGGWYLLFLSEVAPRDGKELIMLLATALNATEGH
jgi:hypothetical protein